MKHLHDMPFGASLTDDGVRFSLWAPGVHAVSLMLDTDETGLPLAAGRDGWFTLTTNRAGPGTLYQFDIDGARVPDPASRYQPQDVHGPSMVVDPAEFDWQTPGWAGRPWAEAVIYELHVGTFTPEGHFDGVRQKLSYLKDLGVTAIQLMPIADFAGTRNWGYDGVLLYAPAASYGTVNALKGLIDAAHAQGIMVFLDVVYNHFGPDGNFLGVYAPDFFTDKHHSFWGDALDFAHVPVRQYFLQNALYWLDEYQFDGLRFDAVHAIIDEGDPHFLEEMADEIRQCFPERHIHLILENEHNSAQLLERDRTNTVTRYTAQWNDDIHHALHVLATGEVNSYYTNYADNPLNHLGRCLTEGFTFQGEAFGDMEGHTRGEPSAHLPPAAFIGFMQNHDQVGNRAFGDRLSALATPEAIKALATILLLNPQPPMLFMGEEWGAPEPFLFFCDFHDELGAAVREGRRAEFARFGDAHHAHEEVPDPNALETFTRSKLDWQHLDNDAGAQDWLQFYKNLLALRRDRIMPLLSGAEAGATYEVIGDQGLKVDWPLAGALLRLRANLSDRDCSGLPPAAGEEIYRIGAIPLAADGNFAPWSVVVSLQSSETR